MINAPGSGTTLFSLNTALDPIIQNLMPPIYMESAESEATSRAQTIQKSLNVTFGILFEV